MAVAPQTVITTQPITIVQGDPMRPRGQPRDWSTGICGCFDDCCGCILAMCFPVCYSCYVAQKMGENCMLPCYLGNSTSLVMRAHLRGRHNIEGSLMGDSIVTCMCSLCALCQMSRELDNIKSGQATP